TSRIDEEPVKPGQTFTFSIQKAVPTATNGSSYEMERRSEPVEQPATPQPDNQSRQEEEEVEFVKPEPKKVMSLFQKEEINRPSIAKKEEAPAGNHYNNDYYEEIKEKAMKRAHERFEKLRQMRALNQTPEEFREKMDTPAYMRKNVKLQDVRHSSEPNISKYNLNDENEILGNNRFLHDNVD